LKAIDKIIRAWRVRVAVSVIPKTATVFFDIGCHDTYLLKKLSKMATRLDGCDPDLHDQAALENSVLLRGYFPDIVKAQSFNQKYDVIFALAVFEHFSESALEESSKQIAEMLADQGLLVVTVPHPFVDKILDVLQACKLIDGQALEEHHGFDPNTLSKILSQHLILKDHQHFQFGLNNLYIFEKKSQLI